MIAPPRKFLSPHLVAPHGGEDVVQLHVDGREGQEAGHEHLGDGGAVPGQLRDLARVLVDRHAWSGQPEKHTIEKHDRKGHSSSAVGCVAAEKHTIEKHDSKGHSSSAVGCVAAEKHTIEKHDSKGHSSDSRMCCSRGHVEPT
eukprot:1158831-Pelagomonas_calceolata.AAC.2